MTFIIACLTICAGTLLISSCLTGCILGGEFISPVEAQRIEREQCNRKPDAEARRACLTLVGHKWQRYNSEGNYPAPSQPVDPRQP